MNKKSQFVSAWPTAYNMIRQMGLMKDLPPMNKIKLDNSLPQQAGAFGFVTTEDSDENGTLDTMHIVVPNIDRHLQGINAAELQRLKIEDPNRLKQILIPIVELIAHEQGHQKDYRHGEDNPFPGGEHVADQAAQQALSQISTQATNNTNKNDIKRSFVMRKEIISRLVKLAGDLDQKKAFDLSDEVTELAEKFAQEAGSPEGFADAYKNVQRRMHQMQNAQLYHPDGDMMGERVFTSQVDFDWGKYTGRLADQPYYVASGRTELGSVQRPGDPYTYEPAGEGKLRVVSGPEDSRYAIGRVIDDPSAKAPSQQPSIAPDEKPSLEYGGRDDRMNLLNPDPETKAHKLDLDIAREGEKLDKIDQIMLRELNKMSFQGRSIATQYEKGVNPAQKIQTLERGIPFLQQQGYDTSELEQGLAKLQRTAAGYTELLMERRQLRGSPADDAAMDLQPQSADDGAEEKEAEAGLKADELTKNASLNAVFWKPNTKTPFGR
jgi:hypothetical protein